MSYQTFYRKYRSNTFTEMMGQDHIKQTLQNAIDTDRLGHAYIFSGPRGTGKTSTARILAKTINCLNKETAPCLTCATCTRIKAGNAVDVVEIDAASNTGVDHMRTLNEQVNFAPVECEYKLYIIDEAHMLSIGAFNALLKTLEEPPEKTIFILATTEPHKIPVTIHSRCQHLYFHQLSVTEIKAHLTFITQNEGINMSEKSLEVISRNAGGCMRDAISLLDQVFSFKGKEISDEDVMFLLGTAQDEYLFKVMSALFNRDEASFVTQLDALFADGSNVYQLLSDLLRVLQDVLMVKLGLGDSLNTLDERLAQLKALADPAPLEKIQELLDVLSKTEFELKSFSQPELLLKIRALSILKKTQAPVAAPHAAPAPVQRQQAPQQARPQAAPPRAQAPQQQQAPQQRPAAAPQQAPQAAAPQPVAPQPTPQPQAAPAPAPAPAATVSDPSGLWPKFLDTVKAKHGGLYAILKGSSVVGQDDKKIQVKLKQSFKFFEEKLKEEATLDMIHKVLADLLGSPIAFELAKGSVDRTPAANATAATPEAPTTPSSNSEEAYESGDSQQKINTIVSMFEGTLV